MKTENFKIENINGIQNQFEITTGKGRYFKSYDSMIAFVPVKGKIELDMNRWNYSKTTEKYRNIFLNETKAETEKKIKSGEYELVDLNFIEEKIVEIELNLSDK